MDRDNRIVTLDKAIIARHFARSRDTYDTEAVVQEEIARQLCQMVTPTHDKGTVLEVGCGTGLLSRLLLDKLPESYFIFNDLSPEMEGALREKVGNEGDFLAGDAEAIPWARGCRLVVSASCIQWWSDPLGFFRKAMCALEDGGEVVFSTFLPDNLHELRAVSGVGLGYPSEEEIREGMVEAGLREVELRTYRRTLHFPTLTDLLRHLKRSGTNGVSTREVWTPGRVRTMEQHYRERLNLSSNTSLPLTYSGLLGRGRR